MLLENIYHLDNVFLLPVSAFEFDVSDALDKFEDIDEDDEEEAPFVIPNLNKLPELDEDVRVSCGLLEALSSFLAKANKLLFKGLESLGFCVFSV